MHKAFGVWIVGAYEELIVAGEIHDVLKHLFSGSPLTQMLREKYSAAGRFI
jgi:hypothetical protein